MRELPPLRDNATIGDVMKSRELGAASVEVLTVHVDTNVSEALAMVSTGSGRQALIVTDADGTIRGVFSETDYVRSLEELTDDTTVGDVMTPKCMAGVEDMLVSDAMSLLGSSRFRHLPVLASAPKSSSAEASGDAGGDGAAAATNGGDAPASSPPPSVEELKPRDVVGLHVHDLAACLGGHLLLGAHVMALENLAVHAEYEATAALFMTKDAARLAKQNEKREAKQKQQATGSGSVDDTAAPAPASASAGAGTPEPAHVAPPATDVGATAAADEGSSAAAPTAAAGAAGAGATAPTADETPPTAKELLARLSRVDPAATLESVIALEGNNAVLPKRTMLLNTRITDGTSVAHALVAMIDNRMGCVVVVDGQRHLEGLLTTRDVVEKVLARHVDPEAALVTEYMTPLDQITVVYSTDSVLKAAKALVECRKRHLPVVDPDNGTILSIISISDIVAALRPAEVQASTTRLFRRFLKSLGV